MNVEVLLCISSPGAQWHYYNLSKPQGGGFLFIQPRKDAFILLPLLHDFSSVSPQKHVTGELHLLKGPNSKDVFILSCSDFCEALLEAHSIYFSSILFISLHNRQVPLLLFFKNQNQCKQAKILKS